MFDLFGNKHKSNDGEIVYSEYINSPGWKKKRAAKLESAGYKCERCGISKFSAKLDVHHLTYERLGNERTEDLKVLCKACHEDADFERVDVEQDKKKRAALASGFKKWLNRNGVREDQLSTISHGYAQRQKRAFLKYLYDKNGTAYSFDMSIIGIPDGEPEWKPGDYETFYL